MEVGWVTDIVDICVGWCIYRLSTLSAADDPLELRFSSLDLSASIFYVSELAVWININEVIVTCQNSTSLSGKLGLLIQLSFLYAIFILLLLLSNIIVIEAWWVVNCHRLSSFFSNWRLTLPQNAHQAQVIELANVFTCKRCDRPNICRHVELGGSRLVQRSGEKRGHAPRFHFCAIVWLVRYFHSRIDLEDGHALEVHWRISTASWAAQSHSWSTTHQSSRELAETACTLEQRMIVAVSLDSALGLSLLVINWCL